MHDQLILSPKTEIEVLRRRADRLFAERRVGEALAVYDRAVGLGLDPTSCAEARWMCCMLLGNFRRAWKISDRILVDRVKEGPCWHWPRHRQWVWDGRPIAGRSVLVRCYHGLGDTIQFMRFMPQLRAVAREVAVWAQPALLPLLEGAEGIDRLLPLHDGAPEIEMEVDLELMEVPHALRTTLETLPTDVPYLHVDPARVVARGEAMAADETTDKTLRVGLVWAAGDWDTRRSLPLRLLAPLGDLAGVTLYALQRGPALAEVDAPGAPPLLLCGDPTLDVVDTAAIIRNLDLVVSPDTMVAHLAGALGVPVWTLLHHAADWRWMIGRADTPWYPTMQLYRQESPGEWAPVVARVVEEITEIVRRR